MFFNSISYLFFLFIAVIILFLIPGKIQWLWLLICSTVFYYTLLPAYLIVFFSLILVNYYFGILIHNSGTKKQLAFNIALLINLIVLAFFKYFNILESILQNMISSPYGDIFQRIILPLGLSFFVFTILSYLIEIKRGTITPQRHIGIFASSLMFFPKLLQGPIERSGNIFPQFNNKMSFEYNRVVEGLKLMLWGYFKKLVVADRVAIYVDAVYGNTDKHNGTSLFLASFLYAFQIYADFSGYTDIALGSARIIGFKLTDNFKRPYFAISIREFWNRWHISFSTWLRDYLFLPLAYFFSRKMKHEKYIGITSEKWIFLFSALTTFAICGIWHGEGINFLVWGLIFGIYLSYSVWTAKLNKSLRKNLNISVKSGFYNTYKILLTFTLVLIAWIFFRASSIQEAIFIISKIMFAQGSLFIGSPSTLIYSFFGIFILLLVDAKREFYKGRFSFFHHSNWLIRNFSYTFLFILILLFGVFDTGQFIYFKF